MATSSEIVASIKANGHRERAGIADTDRVCATLPDMGVTMVYRFMSFLPLTVIFTLWYRKRRNPLPIMAGHFVINLATVAMLIGVVLSPDAFTR